VNEKEMESNIVERMTVMIQLHLLKRKRRASGIIAAAVMLLPLLGFAKPITTAMLLETLKLGEPWDKGVIAATKTVLFNQTDSGSTNATVIEKVQLGFFTSSDCTGSMVAGFYTTPDGTFFNISLNTPFGLTAAGAWNVGTNKLGLSAGGMATVQSIATTLKTTQSSGYRPQSNFSGSSFACMNVSCTAGECTLASGSGTRNFTLKTTASIGDPADGGVIACMNGALNNLVAPRNDNSIGIAWGGNGTDVPTAASPILVFLPTLMRREFAVLSQHQAVIHRVGFYLRIATQAFQGS
jgi:hypothetical protein